MIKIIHWTYRDVADFLTENGFSFSAMLENSVQSWVKLAKNGEPIRFVDVPFTNTVYTEKAIKRIINQSGIPEEKWMKWAKRPKDGVPS